MFVRGELTTREYDRTIQIPSGKKSIEHAIPKLAVELKADTIRLLDRSTGAESEVAAEAVPTTRSPSKGTSVEIAFHTR